MNGALAGATYSVTQANAGSTVVGLEGELDMSNADALRSALADTIGSVRGTLILDVEQLEFADSAAIALWVSWSKQVGRLEVHNSTPIVRRVIEAMGLEPVLNPS